MEKKATKAAYPPPNDPDPADYRRTEESANVVATLLAKHGIAVAVLNACESAKANSGDAVNLAKVFGLCGVHNVLVMSFMINTSAMEIFLRGFYHSLFVLGHTFSQAAHRAPKLLRERKDRKARLGLTRPVNDNFIPVIYSLGQDAKLVPRRSQCLRLRYAKRPTCHRRHDVSD